MQDYKLFALKFKGQKVSVNSLETLSLCARAWLCKSDIRLTSGSKKSDNSVVSYK